MEGSPIELDGRDGSLCACDAVVDSNESRSCKIERDEKNHKRGRSEMETALKIRELERKDKEGYNTSWAKMCDRTTCDHFKTCRPRHQKKHLSRLAFSPRHPTNDALKNESGGGESNKLDRGGECSRIHLCAFQSCVVCLPSKMENLFCLFTLRGRQFSPLWRNTIVREGGRKTA